MQALSAIASFVASFFATPSPPHQGGIGWASVQTPAQRRYLRGGSF